MTIGRAVALAAASILAAAGLAAAQTPKAASPAASKAAPTAAAKAASTLDGKAIFLANKCNTCHSVSSADIKATLKTSKAPDLTGVASKEDASFLAKFLRKKEARNGKMHMKAFTGTDEEIGALISWLHRQTASK